MIFTSEEVTSKNHCRISSRMKRKPLFTLTHTLFYTYWIIVRVFPSNMNCKQKTWNGWPLSYEFTKVSDVLCVTLPAINIKYLQYKKSGPLAPWEGGQHNFGNTDSFVKNSSISLVSIYHSQINLCCYIRCVYTTLFSILYRWPRSWPPWLQN